MFDTLAEFHLHNFEDRTYALMAHLISVLQNEKNTGLETKYRNLANILGDAEATSMLKLICRLEHVDYLELMQQCQTSPQRHFSPRLLLLLLLFSANYISIKLQIDIDTTTKLLQQLRGTFTIDDPIAWLQRLLTQVEKHRVSMQLAKDDLMHGLDPTNQPLDTAEHRKIKERKLKPYLRPKEY